MAADAAMSGVWRAATYSRRRRRTEFDPWLNVSGSGRYRPALQNCATAGRLRRIVAVATDRQFGQCPPTRSTQ